MDREPHQRRRMAGLGRGQFQAALRHPPADRPEPTRGARIPAALVGQGRVQPHPEDCGSGVMRFRGRKDGFACLEAKNIIDLKLSLQDYASNIRCFRHHYDV